MAGVSPFLNLPLDLFRYVLDSLPANLEVADILTLRQLNKLFDQEILRSICRPSPSNMFLTKEILFNISYERDIYIQPLVTTFLMARLELPSAKNNGFLRSILDAVDFMLETEFGNDKGVSSTDRAAAVEARRQEYTLALCCANTDLDVGDIMRAATLLKSGNNKDPAANALVAAAYMGDLAFIRKLIEGGINVNGEQTWFATPFEQACVQGHPDVVKLLLDKGTDFSKIDVALRSAPLDATHGAAYEKITQILFSHLYGLVMDLHEDFRVHDIPASIVRKRLSTIRRLLWITRWSMHWLEAYDYETFEGRPEFFQVVCYSGGDALEWLLDEWTDTVYGHKVRNGGTGRLLGQAIRQRRPDLVKILILNGATRQIGDMVEIARIGDVDVANAFLDTPDQVLDDYTILNGTKEDRETSFRVDDKVEEISDSFYCNIPLVCAVKERNYDMIEWLVQRGARIPSWVKRRALRSKLGADERLLQALSIRTAGVVSARFSFFVRAVFVVVYILYYWCCIRHSRYAPPTL